MTQRASHFNKEALEEAVSKSRTIADAMRRLGIRPAGSSHTRFKKRIEALGIDTSHLLGRGWNIEGRSLPRGAGRRPKTPGKYTKDMLEAAVRMSRSVAEVMHRLGIRQAGGSHAHIRKRLAHFEIDTSHFLGKGWNAGGKHPASRARRTCQQILVLGQEGQRLEPTRHLRRALFEIGREHRCAECGLGDVWNGRRLVLQIDHINGIRHDNRAENLRFLCPNCHSQTPRFNMPYRKTGEVLE